MVAGTGRYWEMRDVLSSFRVDPIGESDVAEAKCGHKQTSYGRSENNTTQHDSPQTQRHGQFPGGDASQERKAWKRGLLGLRRF